MDTNALRAATSFLALLLNRGRPAAACHNSDRLQMLSHPDNPILPQADFVRREAMVPMRDGTKLYTVIFMKKGVTNGPILLSRTPDDAKGSTERTPSLSIVDVLPIMYREFVNDGYIIVQQDIRGAAPLGRHVRHEPPDRWTAQSYR